MPCLLLLHVKRPTLVLVVQGNQPAETSRLALVPRFCIHITLRPFSVSFLISFPQKLRPVSLLIPPRTCFLGSGLSTLVVCCDLWLFVDFRRQVLLSQPLALDHLAHLWGSPVVVQLLSLLLQPGCGLADQRLFVLLSGLFPGSLLVISSSPSC